MIWNVIRLIMTSVQWGVQVSVRSENQVLVSAIVCFIILSAVYVICAVVCKGHCSDVTMSTMASQVTSLMIVYSTVYSGADQRKHPLSASLAFFVGNWPVTGEFPAQRASYVENVSIITSRLRQNRSHLADDVFKLIFVYIICSFLFKWQGTD